MFSKFKGLPKCYLLHSNIKKEKQTNKGTEKKTKGQKRVFNDFSKKIFANNFL